MDKPKGIIAWFAYNNVAANLLMWVLIIGGLFSAKLINKEIFPTFELNYLNVSVAYPGAAPQEIEEGIVIKIEEAIKDISGIEKMTSVAGEGVGSVNIEVTSGYEVQDVMDEVKLAVDAIATFPANIEKPNIYRQKPENNVIWVSVSGEMTQADMKEFAKKVRDDLANLPAVTKVKLRGMPDYEVGIEVSEDKLKEYRLSFVDVAQAVQNSSVDLPGGAIRAKDGDILLRTKGQAYTQSDFERIVVATQPDGSRIMLPQVASIKDGFQEGLFYTRFDAKPAAIIEVLSIDDQNAVTIASQVKQYIADEQASLPKAVTLGYWGDLTHYLEGRLNMMISNMVMGALLVFLLMAFFLDLKLAFWVMLGIPICFLGTLLLMPFDPFNLTLNMITLFGFLLVLGIVVDDAIVIGESVYTEIESHGHSVENVIKGAHRVAMPATFGVLTTIVAFIPMLMTPGPFGVIPMSIALVIILCLAFSLVESKWILPAHLAHMKMKPKKAPNNAFSRIKYKFNNGLQRFIQEKYRPFIGKCVNVRYSVLMTFIGLLVITYGLLESGKVRWVFFPNIPSDFVQVQLEMENGTAETHTLKVVQEIEDALYRASEKLESQYGQPVLLHSQIDMNNRTNAFIFAELTKGEDRTATSDEIVEVWRNQLPDFVAVKKLDMNGSTSAGGGGDIAFRLTATDLGELSKAANELKQKLATYQGVYGISDNLSSGSQEIRLNIKPEAESLGLSLSDLAQQVRYGFYGYEAQRILRNKEEVKVMVRYPSEERKTLGHLESMMIRTPQGVAIPFSNVAEIETGESFSSINRVDGKRAITVVASVDKTKAEPSKITGEIQKEFLPILAQKYQRISTTLDGASKDEQEALYTMLKGAFFILFTIYALMAIPLKSYSKPLIIMSVIPFGIIGAVFGHMLIGIPLNILSLYGILALSGVVVNDSLVMVDFINKARKQGLSIKDTAIEAGVSRFRAIILTSLTTFIGLAPIMLETSLQAKIVIPMAVSLAFGILFATFVTLILVPSLYVILEDTKRVSSKVFHWWWQPKQV
ncbi:efflux RND transporter permease subunit [Shewanella sp. 202IG2-18]|uniref:efflux RND transporter permease subunit n=1 Tax=Parashewanella hymeniacidonis TaxID=2807618 RepID=UPI00195F3F55|nr:efflux RND transporter permease subunit [Parashewanella hymeniacidonis]MBM7072010.1 efflux RND transporter permease subunit [Parashewanella hymeniacidonis]